jgi:hypothetical protein
MHDQGAWDSQGKILDFANQNSKLWRDRIVMPPPPSLHIVVKR